jgi:glycosyltransferase involved in cell wall biosynthesis
MEEDMKKVDLIVPCYNESQVVNMFFTEAKKVTDTIKGYEFSFIFVDDGSSDNTLDLLKALAKDNACVKYISFSRNFGKESGMYAGLKNSTGD